MDKNRLVMLGNGVSAIIKNMEKNNYDTQKTLLYASGLAGYACHQAVKANKEPIVVVETVDHKRFYFGDALNKYLLEGQYSVLAFCNGFFNNYAQGKIRPDVIDIVKKITSVIGHNDYKIWDIYQPNQVYMEIKKYWDEIYDDIIAVYCQSPQEWPVLFAILIQNIMLKASREMPMPAIYSMALECAIFISKMDDDSI